MKITAFALFFIVINSARILEGEKNTNCTINYTKNTLKEGETEETFKVDLSCVGK